MLKFTLLSLSVAITLLSIIATLAVAQDVEESPDQSSEDSEEDSILSSYTITTEINDQKYDIEVKVLKCLGQQFVAGFTCEENENQATNESDPDGNY